MNKSKELIKNTAIIGIGSLGTKILTFLLLPIYTAVLATEDYGMIDVLVTISSLIIPFATIEMGSGIFRFLIEKKEISDQRKVVSTGLATVIAGLLIATVVTIVTDYFYSIPHLKAFVFYFITMSGINVFSNMVRGLGNNVLYSFSNFLVTLCSLLLNLLFILGLKMGGVSILLATAFGNTLGILCLVFGQRLWRYISFSGVNKNILKEVCSYSIPLIPNTVSWWVVSASDRLIILMFLGASANGIYAAANKIPGIYTTIFTVFSLAWTESVARNTEDKKFVSNTFSSSINVMIYMLLGIISCTSLFFNVLIGENYAGSYFQILILLLAIFFSSCASLLGGIFGAKFKSKTIMTTTLAGALINIIINIASIKIIGLYAASISTLVAYFMVFAIRFIRCKQWYDLKFFSRRDAVMIPILIGVLIGYVLRNSYINIVCIVSIICLFLIQNGNQLRGLVRKQK